jgi:hypothetical protein
MIQAAQTQVGTDTSLDCSEIQRSYRGKSSEEPFTGAGPSSLTLPYCLRVFCIDRFCV